MKVATLNNKFSMWTKQSCFGRGFHVRHSKRGGAIAWVQSFNNRLTIATIASSFKFKPIIIYHSKSLVLLKIILTLLCLCFLNEMTNMLLENSGQVTPERMKRWSQSKNKAKQNKTKRKNSNGCD